MGYLVSNGSKMHAIERVKNIANTFDEARGGALSVDQDHMLLLGRRCMTYMDQNEVEALTLPIFAKFFDEVVAQLQPPKAEGTTPSMPFPDEPSLRGLTNKSAIAKFTSVEFLRKMLQPAATIQYDKNERVPSLKEKYEARLAWVKEYGPEGPADKPAPTLPPNQIVIGKKEDSRITAIRQRIDEVTTKHRWSKMQQSRNQRLNSTLNHLIDHPGAQIFVDRSASGGGTVYRGLDALEKLLNEAIATEVNGSIR